MRKNKQSKKIDIDHLAKLANLKLTKKEIDKYSCQLNEILEYAGKLDEINVSSIPSTARTIETGNITFRDNKNFKQRPIVLKNLKVKKQNGMNYFTTSRIRWGS